MITLTLTQFLIFFGWACVGQLFAIAVQQYRHGPRIAAYGGFSIKVFICENGWRIIATIIAMVVGVVFTEPILHVSLNELTAFLAGFFTDKTVEALINRKKV